MPSPIGHALGAAAAGWALGSERPSVRRTALLVAVGLAPDLDLLFGTHSTYTHSVGAVAIVTLIAWLATRDARLTAAVAAAWASHLLLDWLGSDSRDPIGIMALWPFSTAHYQSGFYVFNAISRRYWMPEQFIWGNLKAAAREVAILLPVLALAYWVNTKVTMGTKVTKVAKQ
jgi:membrane-bound metal-dependent hydrolase YbcI (DUF457 family)